MSNTAIRFAPRTRAQHAIRTGMMAYMGLMDTVRAEQEAKDKLSVLHAEVDQILRDTFPAYVNCATTNGARETRYVQDLGAVMITYKTRRSFIAVGKY